MAKVRVPVIQPPTSQLYPALFGDAELGACLSDTSQVAAMITVEAALASAQARLGVIPDGAAQELARALDKAEVAPEALATGAAEAGVAVPALVTALRAQVPEAAGHWLHWGATSQDIVDTALVLTARQALGVMAGRLAALLDTLAGLSAAHDALPMAGRTRGQVATPISFGLKVARWAQPLVRAEAALDRLAQDAFWVQFGGASGANTAVTPHGPDVSAALAAELSLHDAPPWHTDRAPLRAMARWCEDLALGLAKMAGDVLLLSRSEIGEVSTGAGGGSSTMPQKANPVTAEATLAAAERALEAARPLVSAHAEERDGAAWPLEWVRLPALLIATGAALNHGARLADLVRPEPQAMARTLAAHPGVMAEAASFALASVMSRPEAQARIKAALASGQGLQAALADATDFQLDPASCIPACQAEARRVWAQRRTWEGSWS